jgi:predicted RNA-binding protein with RPS1 domain
VSHPHDVVHRNQKVWIKVIAIINDKIRLSMKDVDQKTGEDLTKRKTGVLGKGPKHTGAGHITGIIINDPKEDESSFGKRPTCH